MTQERWVPVVGLEGRYEVSDAGHVRGVPRVDSSGRSVPPRELTNARMSGRYLRIRLRDESGDVERCLHHMVLEAFVGPRPLGMHACHNDGDRRNNSLGNLRWDTALANQRDKIAHGTVARGSRNAATKLTPEDVIEIRRDLDAGIGPRALARRFGVTREHIQRIRRGYCWSWLVAADQVAAGGTR